MNLTAGTGKGSTGVVEAQPQGSAAEPARPEPVPTKPAAGRRGLWKLLADCLERRTPVCLLTLCALMIAGVFLVDWLSPPKMIFGMLYLAPVALATWYLGRRAGVAMAGFASLIWFVTDHLAIAHEDHVAFVWNFCIRLGVFLVVVTILARVRSLQAALRVQLAKRTQQLEHETAQRVVVERELVAISHREQQRIGHELHDGLGQYLAGISFRAKALEQSLAAQALPQTAEAKELRDLIGNAIVQTRNLARGLDPIELEDNDLVAALRNLAAESGRAFGVQCVFRLVPERLAPRVGKDAALALYRISQEAIRNAVQHGEAQRVALELAQEGPRLKLCISDTGKGDGKLDPSHGAGRDPTAAGGGAAEASRSSPGDAWPTPVPTGLPGMGLHIMRYRANAIGAALEIRSPGPQGFEICCVLPAGAWSAAERPV